MKIVIAAALIALLPASVVASAPQTGKPYYCVGKMVATLDGTTKETNIIAWMKSISKFRMEQKTGAVLKTIISNGSDLWLVDPKKKEATHSTQTPQMLAAMGKRSRVIGDDLDNLLKAGAKKTGAETLDGSRCDVYTLPVTNGLTHTVWIVQGPDKLTKREKLSGSTTGSTVPGSPMKSHTVSRLVNYTWKAGTPMNESLFKPAAGIKIKEFAAPQMPAFAPPGAPGQGPKK